MTLEELIIAVVRIFGSLLVLRWAFAGGIIAVLVDFSDLFLKNLLDLGGVRNYQSFDKWLDQVYQFAFLLVALRWKGPARTIAVVLYLFRIPGLFVFELTALKEFQEYVLHGGRWLDNFTAVEAVDAIWDFLTSPFR